MHIIAAKAVCFGEALKPEFKEYQKQIVQERTGPRRRAYCSGDSIWFRAAPTTTCCCLTCVSMGITGKELGA